MNARTDKYKVRRFFQRKKVKADSQSGGTFTKMNMIYMSVGIIVLLFYLWSSLRPLMFSTSSSVP